MQKDRLIKEHKTIVPTYTKLSHEADIVNEVTAFSFVKKIGIRSPKIVVSGKNHFSSDLIQGPSVFQVLEKMSSLGQYKKMERVYHHMVDEIARFQLNRKKLSLQSEASYDIKRKLRDIADVMRMTGLKSAKEVRGLVPYISEYYNKNALYPFRDATPKNYLVKGIDVDRIKETSVETIVNSMYWIDLRSVNEMTLFEDDYISLVYHYMVPDAVRSNVLAYATCDISSESFLLAKFIRIGRFWMRRVYYKKKYPNLFKRRYVYENMQFYNRQFKSTLREVLTRYS